AFRAVDGGVVNGKAAIDYALANVPGIDANRLYSAGHSSAATVSLLLAEHEPRIKACIAYAPVFNVADRVSAKLIEIIEPSIPDFRQYLTQISPSSNLNKLTCPVFLFHADDDSNVQRNTIDPYAAQLKHLNPKADYVTVPTGEHYDSMLTNGIPKAIAWLKRMK
ncbi:MAG TPA: prolyl oligopeptidase family serine peptidase, partial [Armatimonadota bacterium]|nr:prolyl oligopeptidase family serine peptidase [Armatimonadota bacterium]